jgi:hypothetical protein
MPRRRVGTLLLAPVLVVGGCSLILDFDKPPDAGPADAPVSDQSCMANEPNESPLDATVIGAGDLTAAICGPETDYFRVTVDGTQSLVATITFSNRNGAGDIDLRLLTVDGATTIDESRTSADEETVMCPGGIMCTGLLPAGDYLLQVLGFNAAVQSEYVLHVEITTPPVDAGVD